MRAPGMPYRSSDGATVAVLSTVPVTFTVEKMTSAKHSVGPVSASMGASSHHLRWKGPTAKTAVLSSRIILEGKGGT